MARPRPGSIVAVALWTAAVVLLCVGSTGSLAWAADRETTEKDLPGAADVLAALHENDGWKLVRRGARGGVDIYRKDLADMPVPAFRGEKTVAVDSNLLFEVLVDFEGHAGLSEQIPLTHSEVLARRGNQVEYLQYLDSPGWTLTRDRYWFNRAQIHLDLDGRQGHHRQTWQGIDPARYPKRWRLLLAQHKGAIRTPLNYGSWEVIPLGPNRSTLVYRVLSDPGGTLPKSIQVLVTATTLPDAVLQFEAEALRRAGR